MITIIYTTVKDQLKAVPKLKDLRTNVKDRASARVLEFWQGEVERCDQVLVGEGCEKVADAYKAAGVKVEDLFKKTEAPKPVEVVEVVVETEQKTIADFMDQFENTETNTEQPARSRGRPRKE